MEVKLKSVKAGRKQILSDIHLKIPEGKCVAVLGRNGSGKSTLVNAMTHHPALNVVSEILNITEPVFLGFQKPVEIPEITTAQFLLYLDEVYGFKSQSIEEFMLKYAGILNDLSITLPMLEHPLNKNVSGGENKRIELLQMFIIKPKSVLLDEIDTGLDLDMLITVGEFLQKFLASYKCTTLVVTHNLSFLKYFKVSTVIVLNDGEIVRTEGAYFIKELQEKGFAKTLQL